LWDELAQTSGGASTHKINHASACEFIAGAHEPNYIDRKYGVASRSHWVRTAS
jgi:hypothetical protein